MLLKVYCTTVWYAPFGKNNSADCKPVRKVELLCRLNRSKSLQAASKLASLKPEPETVV